jgi:methylenetetrahydrofolate dehydrogenase (NADP+)/methenyltetrahydrofolate cyclohydrolase
MARLIDGAAFGQQVRDYVAVRVAELRLRHGVIPGLATVLLGEDPASQVYVRSKAKRTHEAGMLSFQHKLPAETSQASLLALIAELNASPQVHGILVQLPLPRHIDAETVINAIDPAKDVDGFHVSNVGMLGTGQRAMLPCTPLGCLMLLRSELGELKGKHALVIGRSNIVGRPMARLLLADDCTVTIAHRYTLSLPNLCRQAEIIVVAVGKPGLIRGEWIRPGATVIDVGITRIERDGKACLVGDIDFASAEPVAGAITPVPGGVGPMTIACLLFNTLTAFCRANGFAEPQDAGYPLVEGAGILREFREAS